MLAKYFSIIAASAAAAFAYTTPTTQCTDACNPIGHPGLLELVPAGTAYTITWTPTTPGTVTILLLRGPAINLAVLFPIVEKIPNTGAYIWNVPTTLEPDTARYGLQLINDANGTFQYSTQFGISNPSYINTTTSSTTSPATTSSSTPGWTNGWGINTTTIYPHPTGSGGIYTNTSVITTAGSTTVIQTTVISTGDSTAAASTGDSTAAASTGDNTAAASTGGGATTAAASTTTTLPQSNEAGNFKMSISGAFIALMAAVAAI